MATLKNWVKDLARGATGYYVLEDKQARLAAEVVRLGSFDAAAAELRQRQDQIESKVHTFSPPGDLRATFQIPAFYDWNLAEPTVQLALRDLCRPGMVCFDVGANAGALSLVMSRLVGPRGVVCSFEASRRIVDKTHWNLVQAGCNNTQVYHRAVFSRSNEVITIYPGSHLNDSIIAENAVAGAAGFDVITLSLDDFIEYQGFAPTIVKMDIEGAEFEALKGAARMIAEARPALILEQSPEDMRCHELLIAAGYRAMDLATYRIIRTAKDFAAGVGIANLLFLHETAAANSPYFKAAPLADIASLSADDFAMLPNGSRRLAKPVVLPAGRYVIDLDYVATGTDNAMFTGVEGPGERPIFRYHAYSALLAGSYRQWVVSLERETAVTIHLTFVQGTDPSFDLTGATIKRLTAFDGVRPPLVD